MFRLGTGGASCSGFAATPLVESASQSQLPAKPRVRLLLLGAAAVACAAAVVLQPEVLTQLREFVGECIGWLRAAGPWVFFGGMALLPAVGFPLLPFTLAAGPAFGEQMGGVTVALCAVAAVAVNTSVSFWLARGILRSFVQRLMIRLGFRLPELPEGTAWQIAFLVRLTPGLPFWTQSYLLGVVRLPLLPYMVASVVVPSLYIVGVVIGGDALWSGQMKTGMIAFGAVGALACALKLWQKLKRKKRIPAELGPPADHRVSPCPATSEP